MKELKEELLKLLEAAKTGAKHRWQNKTLEQIVHLAYIHDMITREEMDKLIPITLEQPYNISELLTALN